MSDRIVIGLLLVVVVSVLAYIAAVWPVPCTRTTTPLVTESGEVFGMLYEDKGDCWRVFQRGSE